MSKLEAWVWLIKLFVFPYKTKNKESVCRTGFGGGGGGKVKKFLVELRMESGESVIKAIEIMMGEVEIMAFYLLSMDTLS